MRYIFIILTSILAFGCSFSTTEVKNGGRFIDLDVQASISIHDLFQSIELIPLETSDECLCKQVQKLIVRDNMYYVYDEDLNLAYVFDSTGKHSRTINKRGNGPGEYILLYDMEFNRFTGDMELLSPMQGIFKYDSLGQDFKGLIALPAGERAAHYFYPLAPDHYMFFVKSRDGKKMLFYDAKEREILSETYEIPKFMMFTAPFHTSHAPFFLYKDTLRFWQMHDGAVYSLDKGKLVPTYQWDFGEHNFNMAEVPDDKDIFFYMKFTHTRAADWATRFYSYGENESYCLLNFHFKNKIYHLLYDKKKDEPLIFQTFDEGVICTPKVMDDHVLYSIVDVDRLDAMITPELLDEASKERYQGLTAESNPVIIKYTFKQNHDYESE